MKSPVILAIDTVSACPAVALSLGDKIVTRKMETGRRQSSQLLMHTENLMSENQIKYSDLTGLLCLTGPGSFTGIRVGLSFLKGIAVARDLPLSGTDHFDVLIPTCPAEGRGLVILESGREEKFIGIVEHQKLLKTLNLEISEVFKKYPHPDFIISEEILTEQKGWPKRIEDVPMPVKLLLDQVQITQKDLTSAPLTPYYIREADVTSSKTIGPEIKAETK